MMEICSFPEIWKSDPAALVQGGATQGPPPVVCPTGLPRPELRQAAGTGSG
ncbi:MAG: hypothetical protein IJJ45_02270 [Clostridia bacterium]|nr:hypothetical protein [Clostridia bacterium]